MGGKVVKNAAGFDLPKFFVGSLGRFGVLAEITFKVFPQRPAARTLQLEVDGAEAATRIAVQAASSRWEPDALDCLPNGKTVCLRLAGPTEAVEAISREILSRWKGQMLAEAEAEKVWSDLGEFCWAPGGPLIKVPITPAIWPKFDRAIRALDGARIHVSAGGNVALVSLTDGTAFGRLEEALHTLGLCGLTLRGEVPLWSGVRSKTTITSAVKEALDPQNRFPSLED